ncbi:relaxase/mobilization nuclease domain-containing protein [Streptomyces sp. IB2014 016-6]|uniref:relaxase/mobilization nuclease domain-containing protein n=1 Tax=Streptomyces sp. IB2014 016-6 TaxID=2517818 RepID=UPI0011C94CF1|nr:relaxase/mobilization nuclease domain-containing protein [Streptomyces sp. IB2014 016-6]TXL83939.1 mobilization protein [Streptomyces sp. IB2014 016-6]
MIPRVHKRGSRTVGLVFYLYEPGRCEEHTDPHLVAAWDAFAPDPGRHPDATYADLARLLDQPVDALTPSRRPDQHVWHLSVRAAPEDPHLTDEQWADIARRMVAATGIAPTGDDTACRWAAVRHADDHIHIVATLVREDGRRPRLNNDAARAQAEARLLEAEYGLRQLNPGDGTAAKRPTSAERHKAARERRPQTPREELRETVRHAAAGTLNETEFFERLTAAGLLVHQRVAPSGDLLGYKVALPDDHNHDGAPVFYAGSTLAPDLSLPKIRRRWTTSGPEAPGDAPADAATGPRWPGPAGARRRASTAMWQALLVIDHGTDEQIAARITGAGEVLDALATTSDTATRSELRQAAFLFERATRSHTQAVRVHDRALRQAARDLVRNGPVLGNGEDGASTAMVIDMAFFLVTAAAHWHARKNHAQQAAAARQSAEHLRAAYQAAAHHPMAVLRQRGGRLPQPRLQRQAAHLRTAVPELAEQILAEPGWPALAATLTDIEAAGHQPATLLAEATRRRELDTADSISDVLVWRLRRAADLPADPEQIPVTRNATAPRRALPGRRTETRTDRTRRR